MIVGVVLSAGESRRMGSPKALLSIGGSVFIERIVSALEESRVGKIIVVLGHHAEEIKAKIGRLPITVVVNKDYTKGQLSSLIVAIRSLEAEKVDGALVHLVDHPFVNPTLIRQMIDNFYEFPVHGLFKLADKPELVIFNGSFYRNLNYIIMPMAGWISTLAEHFKVALRAEFIVPKCVHGGEFKFFTEI